MQSQVNSSKVSQVKFKFKFKFKFKLNLNLNLNLNLKSSQVKSSRTPFPHVSRDKAVFRDVFPPCSETKPLRISE